MEEKTQKRLTSEEIERAFQEVAVFLFGQYKKSKQAKMLAQEDAA